MSNPTLDTHHSHQDPNSNADPQVPLRNLSQVRTRIDSLRTFLSQSINSNTPFTNDQITVVSNQIASVINHTIVNAAALVSYSQNLTVPAAKSHMLDSKIEPPDNNYFTVDDSDEDHGIVELDAVELLAEHLHFCEICGKGFKRDANLRMHMRAHGNKFKTPEALAKPLDAAARRGLTRFSCPFEGCNRNKKHMKFKALKSVICVKNHFKRSHCPKMYSCDRCHNKKYSVLSDLKSHVRQCGGQCRWKCSCGTTFSRKDKLFGHIGLFEGHMPAVVLEDGEEKEKHVVVEGSEDPVDMDEDFFDDFGFIDKYCLREVLGFSDS